jgi:hypothetical protein
MATFEKDLSGWNELLRSKKGDVFKHIDTLTQRLYRLSRRQVGKKTMKLYRSIKASTEIGTRGGPVGTVLADNKIALIHHNGSRAHIIRPRRQTTLRFPSRGRIVYTKLVHHPGTKPNRFLTEPLRSVID